MVLGTIDIVLVTEDADGHVGARDGGELDGSRETLVTLGVIVLEADLELDRLEEVPLLGLVGVLKELLDVYTFVSAQLEKIPIGGFVLVRTPATEIFDILSPRECVSLVVSVAVVVVGKFEVAAGCH